LINIADKPTNKHKSKTTFFVDIYRTSIEVIIRPKTFGRMNRGFTLCQKNGLYAVGYKSRESEPIWLKSGIVIAKCCGLALADFEHYPRSSDSFTGS